VKKKVKYIFELFNGGVSDALNLNTNSINAAGMYLAQTEGMVIIVPSII